MFKEAKDVQYLGYDEKANQSIWQYKIIDDDFEEVVVEVSNAGGVALIDCYTKRGLPVAPNMIRLMLQIRDAGGYWTLDKQVEWHKMCNPRWHEIEADMQLYLLFS